MFILLLVAFLNAGGSQNFAVPVPYDSEEACSAAGQGMANVVLGNNAGVVFEVKAACIASPTPATTPPKREPAAFERGA